MSEKRPGKQRDATADEILKSEKGRELEYLANFTGEYFNGMRAGQTETSLANCSPHLRCVAARSLLARHEGPLTEEQIRLILEIAGDGDNVEQIRYLGFRETEEHQGALLWTLVDQHLDELTDQHREYIVDTCLKRGLDGKLLLPLATAGITPGTIDKMIGTNSGGLLRNRLIEQVGGRLSRQQVSDIIDAETATKLATVEVVSHETGLGYLDSPDMRRGNDNGRWISQASAEMQADAITQQIFSSLVVHEDIFLSPDQIRKLAEHGDSLVHLDLISRRGRQIRPEEQDEILAGTSPSWLLANLVNDGVEMPEWKDRLTDAVVAELNPDDWRSARNLSGAEHTAHFSAGHIDALIGSGNLEFVFLQILRHHPEKLLPRHADQLLANHGHEIRPDWMKLVGRHLGAERLDEITAGCRHETALAFIIDHPDKFSAPAEQIDAIFAICSALEYRDRRFNNYLNTEGFVAKFGAHLSSARIDELLDENDSPAFSYLLRDHGDKISDEQLQRFFDKQMEYPSVFQYAIRDCGRQLLLRVDGLIDKLLDAHSSSANIDELIKACGNDFSLAQIDQLLSSVDGLGRVALARHCLPTMPSDRIDKLLELSSSRRVENSVRLGSNPEREERCVLEAIANHGQLLSSVQIAKLIEADRQGTAAAKLLANHHHRLEPEHLDAIAWKFGYLDNPA